jgi:class 3 adenylate cyclase/predicted ATPase
MNQREKIEKAIASLKAQNGMLDESAIQTALDALREKLDRLQGGSTSAREPQQRKQVTIFFADVSGFTAMAETMDHEEVSSVINSLWSRVDKAILDHGGRIDKHIGDAVMAIFGTPIAQEDDPERAIRAALQVQFEIKKWKKEFDEASPDHPPRAQNIHLRIGINTGPALLGTIGTTNEYTAIGDTVNLASRVEHSAPLDGIQISHDTFRHVRGIFDVTALEPIIVKGKSEPIQVYVVNGVKPRSFRVTTRGVEGIETRMIGREQEFMKMKAAYEATNYLRQIHLVNLVAEAGTGKSRLLYEFNNWLDVQSPSPLLMKGRATQEMLKVPYGLLRDTLSSIFNIQDTDPASTARNKLKQGIASFVGEDETATIYTHFIGHLIGFDFSTSPHLQGILGDARQIRDLAFNYLLQFFVEASLRQTLAIFLEDIHWADNGSLDAFDHILNTRHNLPIYAVTLTRQSFFENRPDWGTSGIKSIRLDLQPLSREDCKRLVAEILQKVPEIPAELTDLIVDKAEGSPFYIEELIKVLIESGVIVRGENSWRVEMKRLDELTVPATLTGVLQARLDSLPMDHRETLQQASVIGRVFWTGIVNNMRNPEMQETQASTSLDSRLKTLRSKELIFPYEDSGSSGMPEYIFKSAILHNVTYESVLLRFRRAYHIQVAEELILASGERANEYSGRIGEHYEYAGEWLKSAEWYMRAGKQARDTYSSDAAVNYFKKALSFLREHGSEQQIPDQLETCLRLSEVLNWQAAYTESVENYKYMLGIAEQYGDPAHHSRALQGMAQSLTYLGEHRSAIEYAEQAEKLARKANSPLEIARALWVQGSARFRLGETQACLELGKQALEIAKGLDNRNDMARCLNLLGAANYILGHYRQAETYWSDALEIFQELGNRNFGMDLLSNLGVIADAYGDYELAYQRYHSALEVAREVGSRDSEIVFLSNRGSEQVALKRYAAAEQDLRQAIEMAGITGSWVMPNTFNYHAEALLGLGKLEEAFYSARQSLVLSVEDELPENIGMAWRTLGLISARMGTPLTLQEKRDSQETPFDTEACFAKSNQVLLEAEIEGERARTLREWAKYKFQSGDRDGSEALWNESREIFTKLGAQKEVERMNETPF